MSHSFSVDVNQPLYILQVTQEAGIEDLKFLDGYGQSKDGLWPEELSYLYRHNISVRTVEAELIGSKINIRIFAASSPDDYDLALSLVAAIAKLQGTKILPEDNDEMTLEEFLTTYDTGWATKHGKDILTMILGSAHANPDSVSRITGVHGTMRLGPRVLEQVLNGKQNAATAFYSRLRTLNYIDSNDIYRSINVIYANKENNKNIRVSSYTEDVPTLISDKNTLVTLNSDTDPGNRKRKLLTVPAHELPGLIGDDALWLSEELLFVPGFTGDRWRDFILRADKLHIEDMFEHGYDPENDPHGSEETQTTESAITEGDLEVLAYAPVAVFCFVAASDGSIDKKEVEAFQAEVLTGIVSDNELMQKILLATMTGGEELFNKLLKQEVNVLEQLQKITSILDEKSSKEEALHCKKAFLKIGLSVAQASGGFLGRFGSKVSKEEKRALAALALIFGVIE